MKRKNWLIAIILAATTGIFALQNVSAPAPEDALLTPSTITTENVITEPPVSNSENCAYMWAYHNAPELTEKLKSAFLAIDPAINARAEYFGEDCVYTDGHSTFGVMETDFYTRIPVDDLTNEEALGNWMSQVLTVILQLPREEIQGNYGFVEFTFENTETDRVIVRVPIQLYINSNGTTGAALFQMFHNFP